MVYTMVPYSYENAIKPIAHVRLTNEQATQRRMFNQLRIVHLARVTNCSERDIMIQTGHLNNFKRQLGLSV